MPLSGLPLEQGVSYHTEVASKVGAISGVFLVLAFWIATPMQSFAQALENAYVSRTSVGSDRIEGLKWVDVATFRIEPATANQPPKVSVLVAGNFQREEWRLIAQNRALPQEEGGFRFWILLNSPKMELEFLAIGPFGQVQRERVLYEVSGVEFTIRQDSPVPEADKVKAEAPSPTTKRYVFSPGIGLTLLGYRQTDVPDVDQIAITGKASAVYILNSSWDVGLSGYMTLASITGTTSVKETARFLGVNARAGYTLPFVKQPWKIAVLAGWYYTTMFVEGNQFGFRNMAGPQLFPTLRYAFPNGASGWLYGKYSPVSEGIALSFSNRELAFGGGYAFKASSGRSFSMTLDIAELGLQVDEKVITSNSFSVGVGLSL